ncbi:MAG: hypothetical protein QIT35_gp89 [Methanophagales virus PBV299]|uniref:Capsid protein n=1 Tax=Methanophagales virus PBV299 TaxID=2987730 RepID=A0ABY6GNE0_9CAUD|nr:MAG: hypothetical protein QIT35_gp89 [Methanophagales virus PBV299]UYL64885.1 MAG: hypothetical protein OFDIEDLO_00089 [Methanophagales virus PBV299]
MAGTSSLERRKRKKRQARPGVRKQIRNEFARRFGKSRKNSALNNSGGIVHGRMIQSL